MVAVSVRVGDDEARRLAAATSPAAREQLVDRAPERKAIAVRRRAGVVEERPVVADQQIEKRRLEVDALALPQDERIVVVGDHLDRRIGRSLAIWCAVNPANGLEVSGCHESSLPIRGRALAEDRPRVLLVLEALVGGLANEAVAGPAGELGADDELGAQPLGIAGGGTRRW